MPLHQKACGCGSEGVARAGGQSSVSKAGALKQSWNWCLPKAES
jgi:hypothetical protein